VGIFAAAYAANPDDYEIHDPVFQGVTVSTDTPADHATTSQDDYVTFIGIYTKLEYTKENKSILFLGGGNNLYYPQPTGDKIPTIGAFRAYFLHIKSPRKIYSKESRNQGVAARSFLNS